ncbi:MAG: alanine racemase [Burkholderiaceae bacterium]|nr:alanine racemase [Burkholderiaceae bacterium]
MPRPLVAITDLDAMRANLSRARAAMPGAKVWAVVKADAYGHGLLNAMRGLAFADGLSLVELDRAVQLREAGWRKPLMMMEGMFDPADLDTMAGLALQPVVHNDEQLAMLASFAGPALDVHLKINTGMNRLGFRPERLHEVFGRLRGMRAVRTIALLTHFANADNPQSAPSAELQWQRLREQCAGLDAEISLSNSAALLHQPAIRCDWVRPGVMLYGGSPGGGTAASFGLRAAMTLQSRLISVQALQAGDSVGYGSVFTADRPMRIGIVACGYADGYPRHAPTGTPVLVDGVRTRLLGRVSMDMLAVDLTPAPGAAVGTPVVLWGDGLPIDEVAEAAGTISYELMCAIAPRVRREVRGDLSIMAAATGHA